MMIVFECSLSALPHLFDSNMVDQWNKREIPGGAAIQVETALGQVGDSRSPRIYASLISILLTFGANVAAGLVAAWLYDKLTTGRQGMKTIIRVKEICFEVTPESMQKVIVDSLEMEVEGDSGKPLAIEFTNHPNSSKHAAKS